MERHMEGQAYQGGVRSEGEISGWAVGFIAFASMLMILMGSFQAFTGLVALFDNSFFVTPREYFTDFSPDAWGWIHLVVGIVVVAAGIGLLSGAVWARVLTILLALVSAFANFAFIPYYPVWSIIMIAVAIGVIWALLAHGRDLSEITET
jgi:hypothetical protein